MVKLLWVCLGGAIGSGARYLVSVWALEALGAGFPYATLAVNAVGSFLICLVMELAISAQLIPQTLALFLVTGVLGGFTTYSAFDYETFRYAQAGAYRMAALYVGATLVGCFAAGAAGNALARLVSAARAGS